MYRGHKELWKETNHFYLCSRFILFPTSVLCNLPTSRIWLVPVSTCWLLTGILLTFISRLERFEHEFYALTILLCYLEAPVHKSTIGVKKSSTLRKMCCKKVRVSARISMGRLRAPMTFKFGEVASFVVKDNLYYARPSASTATENRLFLTTSTKSKLTWTNVLSFIFPASARWGTHMVQIILHHERRNLSKFEGHRRTQTTQRLFTAHFSKLNGVDDFLRRL